MKENKIRAWRHQGSKKNQLFESSLPPGGVEIYDFLFITNIICASIMLISGIRKPMSKPTFCCTAATTE